MDSYNNFFVLASYDDPTGTNPAGNPAGGVTDPPANPPANPTDPAGGAGGTGGAGDGGAGGPGAGNGTLQMTQAELDKIVQDRLAQERRQRATELEQSQAALKEALQNYQGTAEVKEQLETQLQDTNQQLINTRKQLLTKEQQLEADFAARSEQLEQKVSVAIQERDQWKDLYQTETIERTWLAAAAEAKVNKPEQLHKMWSPDTKLVPVNDADGNPIPNKLTPMVDFPDVVDGKQVITQRTPADAIARMKEKPEDWGHFFATGVNGGLGGGGNGAAKKSADGSIDLSTLTGKEYLANREAIKNQK